MPGLKEKKKQQVFEKREIITCVARSVFSHSFATPETGKFRDVNIKRFRMKFTASS